MTVSRDDVLRVAALARLRFEEEDLERLAADMNAILGLVDQLDRVDTAAAAPMASVLPLVNAFREDEPAATLDPDDWLRAAPWREGPFPGVPRFVEE
ncbi:MAG: Asp-tRNA(Asn)/Glu-tRNA(Gln) amidotransferase subunit GatC [bacterium]|nr:Asp-tRNA(Asn)/Glu-tRNA(Gln) amidotransferase subunit GatC [bacterium]